MSATLSLQERPVQELHCVYYFDATVEDFVLHSIWNYGYEAHAAKIKLDTQFSTVAVLTRTLVGLEQDILRFKKQWIVEALQQAGWDGHPPGFIARKTVAEPTQIEARAIRQVLDSIMHGRCFICDWTMGTSEGGCTPFNCSMRWKDGCTPPHILLRRGTLNLVLEWMRRELPGEPKMSKEQTEDWLKQVRDNPGMR